MRLVILGATGNVGTSLIHAVADDPAVESVLGVARRRPDASLPKTTWAQADISRDDLVPLLRGADAVVHLAWLIQPSRDGTLLWRVNVGGSRRVFEAAAEAGVRTLVYASSVGAYSPGPKDRAVDESWPTDGIPTLFYARHKAEVERLLDRFEQEHPEVRVVRLRPGLIFKHDAASGIRRLFAGPLFPSPLAAPGRIPVLPDVKGMRFQAVHSLDVGDAYRLAVTSDARGAFNIAAEPVLDPPELASILHARLVPMPGGVLRALADASYRLRLQPSPPGWIDLALTIPVMDCSRAARELGWKPTRSSAEALLDLLAGLRHRAGAPTPPLDPGSGGPARAREILTGVGARDVAA